MNTPIIIGIHGMIGSGKDTLAQMLSVQLQNKGYSCERIGFADALKREVAIAILQLKEGWDELSPEEKEVEIKQYIRYINENKEHFRLILQGWGTDFRRQLCGEDYWVRKWKSIVSYSQSKIIFAPDVRFQNEYDIIKSMHGHLIMICNNRVERGTHASEQNLGHETFYVVANNGTLLELESQARRFISVNGL